MKKSNARILLSLLLMLVGLGFLISGIFVIRSHKKFMKTAVPVTAVIVDIQKEYNSDGEADSEVYVSYQYDGVRYDHIRLGYYSSSMKIGQSLEVLCDGNNPEKISTKGAYKVTLIVLYVLGGIIFLLGLILLCVFTKKKNAVQNGTTLLATVEKIEAVTNPANSQNVYVIYCTYRNPDNAVTYRFRSEYLAKDPNWQFPVGSLIPVLVNPNDYTRYFVMVETKA